MYEFSQLPEDSKCVIKDCYKCDGIILEDFIRRGILPKIREFKVRRDDTLIASYPRTGTTWTEKILAGLVDGPKVADTIDLEARFPFMEFMQPDDPSLPAYNGYELALAQKSPRFLKTHLPFDFIPAGFEKQGKVILITRNPKYDGGIETMHKGFLADEHVYGGYFQWCMKWWNALKYGRVASIYILSYENLIADFEEQVGNLARFIGYNLNKDKLLEIARISSFGRMRETVVIPGVDNFIYKGRVGRWREILSKDQSQEIEDKVNEMIKDGMKLPIDKYVL